MPEEYEAVQLTTGTMVLVDKDVRREIELWIINYFDGSRELLDIDDIYGSEHTLTPGCVVAIWRSNPAIRKASRDHDVALNAENPA